MILFDMGRTGINVVGDMSAAMIMTKFEDKRDRKKTEEKE